ncbi:MAG TPA: dihydrolipoamide acetyltransferase family protein [Candidatus Dormibacteraeota bacterium]
MPTEVIMPALGLAQETGRLLRWIKAEGQDVAVGDLLMEIETDKSAVEIEAPAAGTLSGVRVAPGEEVAVGTVMAWLLAPGEELPAAATVEEAPPPELADPQSTSEPASSTEAAAPLTVPGEGRLAASPLARRLARESDVTLAPGGGSGPDGAFVAADIGRLAGAVRVAPGNARHRTAVHTTAVWTTTPHFYLSRDARAGRLCYWLQALRRRSGLRVTYTDLLLRLVGSTLRQFPNLNDYWVDGQIQHRDGVGVALAIATERGLLLSTIRDPDLLSLAELTRARESMLERAQAGKLSASDATPASITISNLGMFGVDRFQAVLTEGQSALLAVGRIRDEVVAVAGRPSVEPVISVTLSCDHRVLDGAVAAPFLGALVEYLEQPELLLDPGSTE